MELKNKANGFGILSQIFLTVCFFYVLTGGAFLIDWQSIPNWKKILRFSTSAAVLICAGAYAFLYWKDKKKLFALQPFRWVTGFFYLPAFFSVSFLYGAYFVTQLSQQLAMQYGLGTHLWDMGFFDQVLWNTARGDFLITSVRGGIHVFAEHFKPILAIIAQPYRWKDEVWLLLVATNLVTASSLIAVYLIAKEITQFHRNALAITLCAFFYQPMVSGNNFLYHTQMLIDPFILWGFYSILKRQRLLGILCFVFALASKESAILDLFGLSLFLFARRMKPDGGIVAILAIAWLSFFIFYIEPRFIFAGHFKEKWTLFRGWLHPTAQTFSALFRPNPVYYMCKILGPFLFLSFACRRWWLLLGPSFLFRIFSLEPGLRSTNCHYMGGFEALIFISAAYGFETYAKTTLWPMTKNLFFRTISLLARPEFLRVAVVVCAILFSGYPQLVVIDRFLTQASKPENQRIIQVIENIPSNYSVLGNASLAAHFSHRSRMYVFCSMFKSTPYEKSAQHPDLILYDVHANDACGTLSLEDFIKSGYALLFEADFLKIYYDPRNHWPDLTNLKSSWTSIAERSLIPYRQKVRTWYQFLLVAGLVVLVITSAVFPFKNPSGER